MPIGITSDGETIAAHFGFGDIIIRACAGIPPETPGQPKAMIGLYQTEPGEVGRECELELNGKAPTIAILFDRIEGLDFMLAGLQAARDKFRELLNAHAIAATAEPVAPQG